MLSVEALIDDRREYRTANVFGFIAYSERNPYVAKVLRDNDFWMSLNARTEGWILYAIKPDSSYFAGGNAEYINKCLGLTPDEYPQLIILGIGSDRVMMQRNYPLSDKTVDDAYASIKKNIDIVTAAVEGIYPEYKTSTHVHREVVNALDAELATHRWKKVSVELAKMVWSILKLAI